MNKETQEPDSDFRNVTITTLGGVESHLLNDKDFNALIEAIKNNSPEPLFVTPYTSPNLPKKESGGYILPRTVCSLFFQRYGAGAVMPMWDRGDNKRLLVESDL